MNSNSRYSTTFTTYKQNKLTIPNGISEKQFIYYVHISLTARLSVQTIGYQVVNIMEPPNAYLKRLNYIIDSSNKYLSKTTKMVN